MLVNVEDIQKTRWVLCDLCLLSLSNNMKQLRRQVALEQTGSRQREEMVYNAALCPADSPSVVS